MGIDPVWVVNQPQTPEQRHAERRSMRWFVVFLLVASLTFGIVVTALIN